MPPRRPSGSSSPPPPAAMPRRWSFGSVFRACCVAVLSLTAGVSASISDDKSSNNPGVLPPFLTPPPPAAVPAPAPAPAAAPAPAPAAVPAPAPAPSNSKPKPKPGRPKPPPPPAPPCSAPAPPVLPLPGDAGFACTCWCTAPAPAPAPPPPAAKPKPTRPAPAGPGPGPAPGPAPPPKNSPRPPPRRPPLPAALPAPAPAPSSPPPSPPRDDGRPANSVFRSAFEQMNYYRDVHGVPPLVWNESLQAGAQAWSDECVFEHDLNSTGVGENMFAAWDVEDLSPSYVLRKAVDSWYKEVRDYDWNDPEYTPDAGHFTQLIWRATRSVGCGITDDCEGNMRIVVCRYFPAGNDADALPANVPLPVDAGALAAE
jgi:hypothetical protein